MPTTICILFLLISTFPETKTLSIHAKKETITSKSNKACLLKSKTSDVHGRKKMGVKNIAV